MSRPPTIYVSMQWGDEEHALVIWRKEDPWWVEVRGTYDENENDPLQKVIDSLPGWFVSGIFSSDVETVTYWERYIPAYEVLRSILDAV